MLLEQERKKEEILTAEKNQISDERKLHMRRLSAENLLLSERNNAESEKSRREQSRQDLALETVYLSCSPVFCLFLVYLLFNSCLSPSFPLSISLFYSPFLPCLSLLLQFDLIFFIIVFLFFIFFCFVFLLLSHFYICLYYISKHNT